MLMPSFDLRRLNRLVIIIMEFFLFTGHYTAVIEVLCTSLYILLLHSTNGTFQ